MHKKNHLHLKDFHFYMIFQHHIFSGLIPFVLLTRFLNLIVPFENHRYHLILENDIVPQRHQDRRYRILGVNRMANSPQYWHFIRKRVLGRLSHLDFELCIEVTVEICRPDLEPTPTTTRDLCRTIYVPSIVTMLQYTAVDVQIYQRDICHCLQ